MALVSKHPSANCPDCAWAAELRVLEEEELVRVATQLEEHLGLVHDVSWARAWEYASEWLRRVTAR